MSHLLTGRSTRAQSSDHRQGTLLYFCTHISL